jgi:mono/diheme cytochrome c family protein
MTTRWLLAASLVCLAPAAIDGQQPGPEQAGAPAARAVRGGVETLSTLQREGRRVFQQKCAVCHMPILPTDGGGQPYARLLRKSLVEKNEESVRRAIADGTGPRMPGWKYTLKADQIDALVSYLKTLENPGRTVGAPPSEF